VILAIFGPLVDIFIDGGWVMYPLLLCSILGLIFIIERLIYFHRMSSSPQELFSGVRDRLLDNDLEGALKVTNETKGPVSDIQKAGLLRFGRPHEEVLRAIESVSLHEISKLEKGLWILATIANIAPILGFLGTVTGMIDSFDVLAEIGFGNPKLLAAGISQALITTATGLAIAFPVQAAYNYLTNQVNNFALMMETTSAMLLETFSELEEAKK
jgi:biopolymer transport protein ExbB